MNINNGRVSEILHLYHWRSSIAPFHILAVLTLASLKACSFAPLFIFSSPSYSLEPMFVCPSFLSSSSWYTLLFSSSPWTFLSRHVRLLFDSLPYPFVAFLLRSALLPSSKYYFAHVPASCSRGSHMKNKSVFPRLFPFFVFFCLRVRVSVRGRILRQCGHRRDMYANAFLVAGPVSLLYFFPLLTLMPIDSCLGRRTKRQKATNGFIAVLLPGV